MLHYKQSNWLIVAEEAHCHHFLRMTHTVPATKICFIIEEVARKIEMIIHYCILHV